MRVLALISLLALACVATLGRTHPHGLVACGSGDGAPCAACQLGFNPGEVCPRGPALVVNAVKLEYEPLPEVHPRTERCLAHAPKQGPPVA